MSNLPHELAATTAMVAATVVLHLAGLDILLSFIGLHLRVFKTAFVNLDRLIVPLGIVLGLFALHGLEIWLYAGAYLTMGLEPDLERALFLSISSYSTLGASGAVLPAGWRVFGALEAVNGMLLIGWSTAFLFQVLRHLLEPHDEARLPRGAISRTGSRPH